MNLKEKDGYLKLNLDIQLLINSFESIFKKMRIKNSEEAAAYYTLYICLFPKVSITKIHEEAIKGGYIEPRSRRPIETGKTQLLKNGIIAEVLQVHFESEFSHEKVIPINPIFLLSKLEDYYNKGKKDYEEFYKLYLKKFGKLGIVIEHGAITLYHSNEWAIYMLLNAINNLRTQDELLMRVSGFTILKKPYNLEKILEKGQKTRLIITSKELNKETIGVLKRKYKGLFSVRYHPIEAYTTSRLLIFGNKIGVDCRKLLNHPEPCYISTVYLDEEPIKILREGFEIIWNMSEE